MELNFEHYKQKLEEEKALLEQEMATLGIQDASGEWEARANELSVDPADLNEMADKAEELGENQAVLDTLQTRYKNILRALDKIGDGTFGKDELDGEPIEDDRLEANPAARTRKANIDRESELEH